MKYRMVIILFISIIVSFCTYNSVFAIDIQKFGLIYGDGGKTITLMENDGCPKPDSYVYDGKNYKWPPCINYLGPTTSAACYSDQKGALDMLQKDCAGVEGFEAPGILINLYKNKALFDKACGSETTSGDFTLWKGASWATLQDLFLPYYAWYFSQQSDPMFVKKYPYFSNTSKPQYSYVADPKNIGGPGNFLYVPQNPNFALTKKLTKEEACKLFFPKGKGDTGDDLIKKIVDTNSCKQWANFCKTYQDVCKLANYKWFTDSADIDAKCGTTKDVGIFENFQFQIPRIKQYFEACANVWIKYPQGPGTSLESPACKYLASSSPVFNRCDCTGGDAKDTNAFAVSYSKSFFVGRGGKSDGKTDNKESCCTICHTLEVTYENIKISCATALKKELVDSCVCGLPPPKKQTFAFPKGTVAEAGQQECCSLCQLSSLKPRVATFGGVDNRCGYKGVGDITQNGIQKFQSPLRPGIVSPQTFIGNLIKVLLGIVGSLAFAMVVWGGFQWMTSAGSSERIKSGQQTVMWAVFGLVAIFISYGVVNVLLGLG